MEEKKKEWKVKCPRCKSENIRMMKRGENVSAVGAGLFCEIVGICQDCGKSFDPDIARYESVMTPAEKAWSRFAVVCIIGTLIFAFACLFPLSIVCFIGAIICGVMESKEKKKRLAKKQNKDFEK